MLGNCDEKMVLISSTNNNQWPQNQHRQIDEKNNMMASTNRLLMEKQPPLINEQQQQPQQPLKCPRCDSSNTKFCYYNNYSLSQPRHFCKACKRYWTRGGTLRNVPVGGGCRKNKRVKRPSSSSSTSSTNIDGAASNSSSNPTTPTTTTPNPNPNSNTTQPSLFYGLSSNPSDLNLPFSRFSSCGYDLQPQLNALGLGFSSGFMSGDVNYQNGFNPNKQMQNMVSSSSLLSNFPTTTTTSPTMASLLASSLHQQKFINDNGIMRSSNSSQPHTSNHFNSLTSFEDHMHVAANGTAEGTTGMKEMKAEGGQSRMDWNIAGCQNQMEQIGLSDPNTLYWNATSVGGWHDPANNIGSSVSSLI